MEYDRRVIDYIDRANKNLIFIENALENGKEVFEFTQLFCNFISILILCKENLWIDSNPIFKHNLSCEVIGDDTYEYDFRKKNYWFIQHLRNACCHDGITIEYKNKEIDSVIFKDVEYDEKNNVIHEVNIRMNKYQIRKVYEYLVENKEKFGNKR